MNERQSSEIRNIIFDLGGVLLNINPLLSLNEFEKISGIAKEELKNRLANEHLFEKFDTGSISPAQFRSELCRIMDINAPDSVVDDAWNMLLLDFPLSRVQLLQQLRNNYRIFLLSNTNIIHFESYTRTFYEKYNFKMTDLFDEIFLSYKIGVHKPDAGIYSYMLEHANLKPSECLFADDLLPNIEAAELQGIAGIHINSHDLIHYFKNGKLIEI